MFKCQLQRNFAAHSFICCYLPVLSYWAYLLLNTYNHYLSSMPVFSVMYVYYTMYVHFPAVRLWSIVFFLNWLCPTFVNKNFVYLKIHYGRNGFHPYPQVVNKRIVFVYFFKHLSLLLSHLVIVGFQYLDDLQFVQMVKCCTNILQTLLLCNRKDNVWWQIERCGFLMTIARTALILSGVWTVHTYLDVHFSLLNLIPQKLHIPGLISHADEHNRGILN